MNDNRCKQLSIRRHLVSPQCDSRLCSPPDDQTIADRNKCTSDSTYHTPIWSLVPFEGVARQRPKNSTVTAVSIMTNYTGVKKHHERPIQFNVTPISWMRAFHGCSDIRGTSKTFYNHLHVAISVYFLNIIETISNTSVKIGLWIFCKNYPIKIILSGNTEV